MTEKISVKNSEEALCTQPVLLKTKNFLSPMTENLTVMSTEEMHADYRSFLSNTVKTLSQHHITTE